MSIELIVRNETIEMSGAERVVAIVTLDQKEGLTLAQTAKLLGVSQQNIKQIIKRQGLKVATLSCNHLQLLRDAKVIHSRSTRGTFISQETIEELVWTIGTPEAKSIYKQLWRIARDPQTSVTHHTEVASILGNIAGLADMMEKSAAELRRLQQENLEQQAKVEELKSSAVVSGTNWDIIVALIHKRLKALGSKAILHDQKFVYMDIKRLYDLHATAHIPAQKYDEVVEFVKQWLPTPGQKRYFKR